MNKQELLEHLHDLLDKAQITKQEMVNEYHEPIDLPPVLWYVGQDGQDSTTLVNQCRYHDHEPPEILSMILVDEYARNGKPVLLTVGAEGYVDMAEDGGSLEQIERGDLTRDFMTNPASKVREAVFVAVCQDDTVGGTEMVQVTAPFTYDDGLQLVWHERLEFVDSEDHEVAGALSDVMRNAFGATEEQWAGMTEARNKLRALEIVQQVFGDWPTEERQGQWASCFDPEVTEELVAIENHGLDVTEQTKTLFAEFAPEFADHIDRADLVWDGAHSFGIGIKMLEPGYMEDPPDPPDFLRRLIGMLNDMGIVDQLEDIPIKHGIFHAMKTFAFREEIEDTLGKEEGNDDDSR